MKKSKIFTKKRLALKTEMIDYIKKALPKDGSKVMFDQDEYCIEVGGYIDCEFHDDLSFLYITDNLVFASLCQEPENEVELDDLHENSLIEIIEYLERHGHIGIEVGEIDWKAYRGSLVGSLSNERLWALGTSGSAHNCHLQNIEEIEEELSAIDNSDFDAVISLHKDTPDYFEDYIFWS